MPKRASNALTALKVKSAKLGVHVDGGGLMLLVRESSASWVFRFSVDGRRRDMGLGPARGDGAVSLAEARQRRDEARALINAGHDPLKVQQAKKAERKATKDASTQAARSTFQAAAEACHQAKMAEWKNPKHTLEWITSLRTYVFPVIGMKPVAAIDTDDVLKALEPIWGKIPETAVRVRGRIETVINYSAAKGLRPRGLNPASWRGHLGDILGNPTKLRAAARESNNRPEHHPALAWMEVPDLMLALDKRKGIAALALRFLILVAARSGEVRKMTWGEVDETKNVWAVPRANMKGGRAHFVPLSAAALALLEEVRSLAKGHTSLVFPGRGTGAQLSDATIGMVLRSMALDGCAEGELPRWRDAEGRAVVAHGFRASFKAWTLAKGWADHLGELALAHADTNMTRAAYARDALIEERRPMMQAWGEWCTKAGSANLTNLTAEGAKRTLA